MGEKLNKSLVKMDFVLIWEIFSLLCVSPAESAKPPALSSDLISCSFYRKKLIIINRFMPRFDSNAHRSWDEIDFVFRLLADRPQVDALTVSNIAVTLGGVSTILVPHLTEYWQFLLYCVFFGFGVGQSVFISQISS
jgi:hypothetical protein